MKTEMENCDGELKHLGFLRVVAINALVLVSRLYECAKVNSGPLKSTVGNVEKAVTAVVGPVYGKLKGFPDHVLFFLDNKVYSILRSLCSCAVVWIYLFMVIM